MLKLFSYLEYLLSQHFYKDTGRIHRLIWMLEGQLAWQFRVKTDCLIQGRGWDWRDGSVVKSTDCSSRSPEFNLQQPHGSSQQSVLGSDALFWCTHIHKINKIFKKGFQLYQFLLVLFFETVS